MLIPRVIPCLLLRNSGLVKTLKFKDPTYLGDPINIVKIFNDKEVDELVFLDITATVEGKSPPFELLSKVASEAFMPLGYGGGIRSLADIKTILGLGIEKVIINSYAVENPTFIREAAAFAGSQSVVVSLDVRKTLWGKYEIYTHGGRNSTGLDPVAFAVQMEAAGAGELLLNAIDQDGVMQGYDLALIRHVTDAVSIPVVACGGARTTADLAAAIQQGGASAAAAGSMFVFHGPHRAVLISYPPYAELKTLFEHSAAIVPASETHTTCTRCVMDTTVPDIVFDANSVCNYCTDYLAKSASILFQNETERSQKRTALVAQIKAAGQDKPYDCIVGLSGGVDSSWTLYQVVQLGLRPLAIHMDNGWDLELAQHNIETLVRNLQVDLYTHVIDWDEYRSLQLAFFAADVIDIELLYDNAMLAVNYQQAAKHHVKFILAGTNLATEGLHMPSTWNWYKKDKKNIYAIWQRFGTDSQITTFPALGSLDLARYRSLHGIHWVSFLDYIDYNKAEALQVLQREFGYRPYPYKHYESVFTRFYQGYILPRKFGVDKRRVHLSTLIISGQMSREQALVMLNQSPYPDEAALQQDIEYVLKKLGWTREQMDAYIARPGKPHDLYGSERHFQKIFSRARQFFSKIR